MASLVDSIAGSIAVQERQTENWKAMLEHAEALGGLYDGGFFFFSTTTSFIFF